MNFFKRIAAIFRGKKSEPAPAPLAPPPQNVATSYVGAAPATPKPVIDPPNPAAYQPAPTPAPQPQNLWAVHGKTIRANLDGPFAGTFTVVENQMTFKTFAEAVGFANACPTPEEANAANQAAADKRAALQPGEIDIMSLTVEDCLVVASWNHIFAGKVGPWLSVARMTNWLQCQGGEPVNPALAAAYPEKDSQFFAFAPLRATWQTTYHGQLRPILDQWVAAHGGQQP